MMIWMTQYATKPYGMKVRRFFTHKPPAEALFSKIKTLPKAADLFELEVCDGLLEWIGRIATEKHINQDKQWMNGVLSATLIDTNHQNVEKETSLGEALSQYSEKVRESVEEEMLADQPGPENTSTNPIQVLQEKHEKLVGQHNLQKQRFSRLEGLYENLTDRINFLSGEFDKIDQYLRTISSYKPEEKQEDDPEEDMYSQVE
jgi:hypothetical protein